MLPSVFDQTVSVILERIIGGPEPAYVAHNKHPEIEHIVAAGWETPDGDIYTGPDHMGAWSKAWRDRVPGTHDLDPEGDIEKDTPAGDKMWNQQFYVTLNELGWQDGFLTSNNRFISRAEAMDLARKARQISSVYDKSKTGLDSGLLK